MQRQLIWKLLLILGIAALCGLAIKYQGVKYGLDLVGGTTLVYEVDVPEGQAVRPALEQTIQVLQERVDPSGVRNMVWRIQGGNRIEIQMAAAPKETGQKRSEYLALQESLLKDNLNLQDLDAVLALPESARQKKIVEMAAGRESVARLLIDLDAANQARQAARQPYAKLQDQVNQLDASIAALPGDAPESQKSALKAKQEKLVAELIEKAQSYRQAQQKYEESHHALAKVNLDPVQVSRVLLLPVKGINPENAKDANYNPRQAALKALIEQHPDKSDALAKLAIVYGEYEKVKGSLDDPNDLITLLRGSGVLEFRIVPTTSDVPDVDQYRQSLRERGPQAGADKPYRWYQLDKPENWAKGSTPAATRATLEAMRANPAAFFDQRQGGLIAEGYGDRIYMLLSDMPQSSLTKRQSDWQLAAANRSQDELGRPAVSFRLNVVGGQYMGALTGSHVNKLMAIVLDGRVMSAPRINSRIAGSGIITGGEDGFTQQELDYLIRTFNAGSLKAKLSDNPISIQQIGATFGEDNLQAGLNTVIWAMIVVCGFMAIYYFFWGMVANAAMLLNILFLLGIMAMFEATFTLPGIAGVVLTIGMAVDANVLIYERIREEIERKADLKTAVRLGFERAFVTILDSNLTTAITCWVLYGCPPFDKVVDVFKTPADIKGFGVALGIGVLANLFTGVFCTRVFIELWMAIFKPKTLPMLAIAFPGIRRFLTPNIDWFGLRWVFFTITGLLGVLGIVSLILRGPDFLDIEFRGGTQVTFNLAAGKTLSQQQARHLMEEQIPVMQQSLTQQQTKLREQLAQATPEAKTAIEKELVQLEHDLAVAPQFAENVLTMGELAGPDKQAKSFVVATLLTDPKIVSQNVKQAFASVLDTTRPIAFAGMGEADQSAPGMAEAPVYAVRSGVLGENIQRANIASDVRPFIGGAVVVLDRMTPATSEADVKQRIERMRYQDKYQALGYRNIQVIGLDWARDASGQPLTGRDGQPMFTSLAVLGHDGQTNYVERPENFQDAGGLADTHWQLVRDAMLRDTSLGSITSFSPQVSASMTGQALIAIFLSWLAILIYVWFRFRDIRFGVGAIVALIHDVVIAVGLAAAGRYLVVHFPALAEMLMIEPFRLNLAMIAAALTLIGYSVNDTIVIFDRIRENRGKLDYITPRIINDSVNQTISRTILTAGTVFIAVLILYIMGGPGVHGFAFIMLSGCIIGCYSSIAIASPILLVGIDHSKLADAPSHTTVVSSLPPASNA